MNQIAKSFGTYFFDNVFLTPAEIDAGVVVPGAEYSFELWHSFTTPRQLAGITQAGSYGIELIGVTSGALASFESFDYKISLNQANGLIDYTADFDFGTGSSHRFSLTCSMALVMPERIDWSTQPEMSIQYLTEVIESFDGTEQRIALRDTPRLSVSYLYSMTDEQQYQFDNKLATSSGSMLVPLWPLQCRLSRGISAGETRISLADLSAHLASSETILISENDRHEVLSVESVDGRAVTISSLAKNDFSESAIVVPLRIAYPADESNSTSLLRGLDQHTITYDLDETKIRKPAPVDDFERLNARPIFPFRPDRSKDLTTQYSRLRETLDPLIGARSIYNRARGSVKVLGQTFTFFSESERQRFEDFAELMNGAQGEFYMEGPGQAFELSEDVVVPTYKFKIKSSGYTNFANSHSLATNIAIKLYNGTTIYKTILSATTNPDGTETITTKELTNNLKTSDIETIVPLYLARFDSDEFRYIFDTSEVSTITKNIRQLLYADPAIDSSSSITV
ncbi:hypothetical protein RDI61_27565 [Pseudomonas plecoglossicida]|uniref:hypothetical protein n=1 Tax=Pseudomonas TaxID=286 RepID=UPI001FFCD887|nr:MULTISPECIES: hypothetical protein [Pseudomonas]MCK2124080.1 hypothetical protein [Pseudomonas sp. PNPG3]MDQ7967744.1 hypothetical protein [Pseudomonas plecoglossicida]WFG05284.1 hypothetical protein P3X84_11860 [Pseudomonas putida]